jgi:hypothetical protein
VKTHVENPVNNFKDVPFQRQEAIKVNNAPSCTTTYRDVLSATRGGGGAQFTPIMIF